MNERSCKNCEWWAYNEYLTKAFTGKSERIGSCRHRSPWPLEVGDGLTRATWPSVGESAKCGDFKPREAFNAS